VAVFGYCSQDLEGLLSQASATKIKRKLTEGNDEKPEKTKNLTYDSPQIRFRAGQLGRNELQHKMFHIILNLRMAHDIRSKCSRHIESSESLLRWTVSIFEQLVPFFELRSIMKDSSDARA
jgi:hypothetical protein